MSQVPAVDIVKCSRQYLNLPLQPTLVCWCGYMVGFIALMRETKEHCDVGYVAHRAGTSCTVSSFEISSET